MPACHLLDDDSFATVHADGDALVVVLAYPDDGSPIGVRFAKDRVRVTPTDRTALHALCDNVRTTAAPLSPGEGLAWFGLTGSRFGFGEVVVASGSTVDAARDMLEIEGLDDLGVDPDVLEAVRWAGADLTEKDLQFYARGGEVGVVRRQAAASFPMLATLLARRARLRTAVDGREGLRPHVALALSRDAQGAPSFGKGPLKKLAKARVPLTVPPETLGGALGEIPPDWIPSSDADWEAFQDVVESFGPLVDLGVDLRTLAEGSKGQWASWTQRLLAAGERDGEDRQRALRGIVADTVTLVRAFGHGVVLPAAVQTGGGDVEAKCGAPARARAREIAFDVLFGGKSGVALVETVRHATTQLVRLSAAHTGSDLATAEDLERERIEAKETFTTPDGGWPMLTPPVVAPNGVEFVALQHKRELVAEGNAMNHCVGRYSFDEKCLKGESHIYSLRTEEGGGRLSTLEISGLDPTTGRVRKKQHYTVHDRTPSQRSLNAEAWFLQAIAERSIPVNEEGVAEFVASSRLRATKVAFWSGYDPSDPVGLSNSVEAWSDYLPRHLRGAPWTALVDDRVRELAQDVVPGRGVHSAPPAYDPFASLGLGTP